MTVCSGIETKLTAMPVQSKLLYSTVVNPRPAGLAWPAEYIGMIEWKKGADAEEGKKGFVCVWYSSNVVEHAPIVYGYDALRYKALQPVPLYSFTVILPVVDEYVYFKLPTARSVPALVTKIHWSTGLPEQR